MPCCLSTFFGVSVFNFVLEGAGRKSSIMKVYHSIADNSSDVEFQDSKYCNFRDTIWWRQLQFFLPTRVNFSCPNETQMFQNFKIAKFQNFKISKATEAAKMSSHCSRSEWRITDTTREWMLQEKNVLCSSKNRFRLSWLWLSEVISLN